VGSTTDSAEVTAETDVSDAEGAIGGSGNPLGRTPGDGARILAEAPKGLGMRVAESEPAAAVRAARRATRCVASLGRSPRTCSVRI